MEQTILSLCSKKGWSLAFFFDLDPNEQQTWVDWEQFQQYAVREEQRLIIESATRTDEKGDTTISAEIVSALVALATGRKSGC
jgi:hypothetical protein